MGSDVMDKDAEIARLRQMKPTEAGGEEDGCAAKCGRGTPGNENMIPLCDYCTAEIRARGRGRAENRALRERVAEHDNGDCVYARDLRSCKTLLEEKSERVAAMREALRQIAVSGSVSSRAIARRALAGGDK